MLSGLSTQAIKKRVILLYFWQQLDAKMAYFKLSPIKKNQALQDL